MSFRSLVVGMILIKGRDDFTAPERQQKDAAEQFPLLLQGTPLHLWHPGDPVAKTGTRFLIGVQTASTYDMGLLDYLNSLLDQSREDDLRIDVFNLRDITSDADLASYYPINGFHPLGTPLVGKWENGTLTEVQSGHRARHLLAEYFEIQDTFFT